MKMAEYTVKKDHYLRLRKMVVEIILHPEVMLKGCHRVDAVRRLLAAAGVSVTERSVRNYFKELKIREKQTEINEKTLELLKKMKPKRYDK